MLDPQTYRANEKLAKSLIPSWRLAQAHNVDVFEAVGFPVRIDSVRELGQIIDTMQENRFERYMAELGGLSKDEYRLFVDACRDVVAFQLSYLPHRPPVLPASTMISAFAIYKKMLGAKPDFRTVLEIGPGCGYVSFFLKHHAALESYSQIEACESFYILQNLVNLHCFGWLSDERAILDEDVNAFDCFSAKRGDYETSPTLSLNRPAPRCVHYPWWRIGEIVSKEIKYDIVTSNANLLEFSAKARLDYLALITQALKPDGIFLVQCTGYEGSGTVEQLLDELYNHKFAPLMFVRENAPATFPKQQARPELGATSASLLSDVKFTTNNAIFVRPGHPLFDTYYNRKNFHMHFIAPEQIVESAFFKRPLERSDRQLGKIVEETEAAFSKR